MLKLNECAFGDTLGAFTIMQLYKLYCRTALLYGLKAIKLGGSDIDRLETF
jgi:hypothetical protein